MYSDAKGCTLGGRSSSAMAVNDDEVVVGAGA